MHAFTSVQYTCFTGDKTTTAVLRSKLTSHKVWVTGLLWSRETSVSTVIFTNRLFSLRKRLWPSETCLTLLGAHFLNSVLEEKTDKDNINSNLYRLNESQTCNLFIEHLDSDQQVWRTFKLVMQCCSWKNKGVFTSHNLTLRLAAPKRPEIISFQKRAGDFLNST